MLHHSSIRNYTAALLDLFNNLEVQHVDSTGVTRVRSVPIVYSTKEKAQIIDKLTGEQLRSGNYNVLPRSSISLSAIQKSEARTLNKNSKINKKSNLDSFDFTYNSVPYEFTYELNVQCRGMNEASQIIEQVAPKFNPFVELDIWDVQNLNTPTRVPVKLLDIGIETEDYDEYSSNICNVSFGLSITGNLYPPIQTIQRIKQFKMTINEAYGTPIRSGEYSRRIIDTWDVQNTAVPLQPGVTVQPTSVTQYPPNIVSISSTSPVILGSNNLQVVYTDADNPISEMTFVWSVLQGNGTISGTQDKAIFTVQQVGVQEVHVKITDPYGNFAEMSKVFTV